MRIFLGWKKFSLCWISTETIWRARRQGFKKYYWICWNRLLTKCWQTNRRTEKIRETKKKTNKQQNLLSSQSVRLCISTTSAHIICNNNSKKSTRSMVIMIEFNRLTLRYVRKSHTFFDCTWFHAFWNLKPFYILLNYTKYCPHIRTPYAVHITQRL